MSGKFYSLVTWGLRKAGKQYTPDPGIPASHYFSVLCSRFFAAFRGLVKFRRFVFVGRRVSINNKRGLMFGGYCTFEEGCQIDACAEWGVQMGDCVKLGAHSIVSCTSHLIKFGKGVKIGDNVGFSQYCYLGASGGLEIGDDVIVGQFVSFHAQSHNFENPDVLIRNQGVIEAGIKVGSNCWIGAKSTFLDGSVIGDNCVVAAGSVVNDVFGNGVVIGGVPARVLRKIDE